MYEPKLIRVCSACKEKVTITLQNEDDMICFKNRFYHTKCFVDLANKRVSANNRYSLSWSNALNNFTDIAYESKNKMHLSLIKDKLNYYLLYKYNVGVVSSRFWSTITDIGNGTFRNKRCKPIVITELYDMWITYERNLDKIHEKNKKNGKNIDGEQLIMYDLAVLLGHYDQYQRKIAKQKNQYKAKQVEQEMPRVVVQPAVQAKTEHNESSSTDISDLIDEIFVAYS